MKLGAMRGDVLNSLFRKPATERYPFERNAAPEQLRGLLHWDSENCTGCGLCAKDCPAQAIEMIVLDRKAKRFVMHYQIDCCTFCAQCVSSCRQGCLSMDSDAWELAALGRSDFARWQGEAEDVTEALAERAQPDISDVEG
jgi:formate hydrogenlyase subunit 6/NADH:ubiquinone oxidoreductase subunit I